MAKHHLLGNEGEQLAVKWLLEKGFIVLHQNWRHSHYEIDIIASIEQVLHFIEVKTRRNKKFGEPEERVDNKKITNLMKAGAAFQDQYPVWKRVQYDVLSISVHPNNTAEYFFIEDVYL
ncbi:MAG: YraN family protein [Chitinophagaceae bacterium]